jgi:hypothetical protein
VTPSLQGGVLSEPLKMELLKLVTFISDGDEAPRRIIDLDRVSVIDYPERRRFVIEVNRWKIRCLGNIVPYVDGRLQMAQSARTLLLFQVSPVRRARTATVAPVV